MNKKVDFIFDILEGIICIFGIIVFSTVAVQINDLQKILFIIADFYCAIKLSNCIENIIEYIKYRKDYKCSTKELDKIMYWS